MTSSWGNSWLSAWGNSWGAVSAVPIAEPTTGGYSDDDFRRYRKHIEKIAKIADERNRKLYVKQELQEIIDEIVEEIPVKVTEIKKLDDGRKGIDFDVIQSELTAIRSWMDVIAARDMALRAAAEEAEDEQILMMVLGVI